MKVQIPAKALRAAGHCMASEDIRYYINGVLLDVTGPTEAFTVGTDGNVLFAGRVELEYLEGQQNAAWSLIIPGEVIKGLDKKADWFVLEALGDGRYMLGGKVFTPIDGKYPEYRGVIPHPEQLTGESSKFNPELLARCVSAIKAFYGLKKGSLAWGMAQAGYQAGVVFGGDASAVAVIMPVRRGIGPDRYHGLLRPCQSFTKAA